MAIIYKGYDQEALDFQYNNRARVPGFQDHVDRWLADSAAARQVPGAKLDLAYGPAPAETLDFFPVSGDPTAPLLAFIHGGYWNSRDKADFCFLAPAFVESGIAFASLNYTLAPAVTIPDMVRQVRAAVTWLAGQGEALGFDARRLHLSGHSAGGHLTAMAMIEGPGLCGGLIRGGCSVSGLYELEPLRLCYQQELLRLDDAAVAEASPTRLPPGRAAPLICAVGGDESEEFLDQQAGFVAAWRAGGARIDELPLPGRDHFTALDALGDPGHPLFQAVKDQILG